MTIVRTFLRCDTVCIEVCDMPRSRSRWLVIILASLCVASAIAVIVRLRQPPPPMAVDLARVKMLEVTVQRSPVAKEDIDTFQIQDLAEIRDVLYWLLPATPISGLAEQPWVVAIEIEFSDQTSERLEAHWMGKGPLTFRRRDGHKFVGPDNGPVDSLAQLERVVRQIYETRKSRRDKPAGSPGSR
jgi:hypothetical protein